MSTLELCGSELPDGSGQRRLTAAGMGHSARVHRLLPPRDEALLRGDRLAQVVRPRHLPQSSAHGRVHMCGAPGRWNAHMCSTGGRQRSAAAAAGGSPTSAKIGCSDGGCVRAVPQAGAGFSGAADSRGAIHQRMHYCRTNSTAYHGSAAWLQAAAVDSVAGCN